MYRNRATFWGLLVVVLLLPIIVRAHAETLSDAEALRHIAGYRDLMKGFRADPVQDGSRTAVFAIRTTADQTNEWRQISESEAGITYVREFGPRQIEGVRRVWVLYDNRVASPRGISSMISFEEYECSQGRHRALQITGYSGKMGSGAVVAEDSAGEWRYAVPGTGSYILLRHV